MEGTVGEGARELRASSTPLARLLSQTPIFAAMQDAVLVAATDHRVVFANEAASRLFEVPADELLLPLSEFPARFALRVPSGSSAIPLAQRALAGESIPAVERLIRTPGGVEKVLRASAAPLRDERGTILGAVVLAADVSARKAEEERAREHGARLEAAYAERARALADAERAAQTLRDEHAFTAAVLDTVENLIVVLDRDGRIVRVNRACERATGYAVAELVGRLVFDVLVPRDDLPGVRETFEQLTAGAFPNHHENRWRMKDGSERLLEWSNTCITDADGAVRFVIGTGLDVTERRRDEERLRESEAWFRTLTEGMPQIVCGLTPDGRAEYVNPRWTAFSGLDLQSTNRAGWGRILHPDDLATAVECRRRVLKSLAPAEVELRYRAADGAFRWFLSRLAPVVENGRVVRFIGAAMDIEDRKRAEGALRDTDRRRTEFLGVLSHELRNPLAPIRNSIYLLEKMDPGSEQATRSREVIRRQTDHLARLVDDLLDVTRISRGKIRLHREPLDLRDVVRSTCEDLRVLFDGGGIELNLDFPAAPVWAEVDATRLAQVVGNLLQNAGKFTPARGRVTVRLRGREGNAEISVLDTGIGIEPAQLARVFEPFSQEDRSLARTRGGLGLGLALAKGLVELHGGTLAAHSAGAGKGSEFTASIPLSPPPARLPPTRPGPRRSPPARRVLVIEDHLDAAMTLAAILELDGHAVTVARTGAEGIHLARELNPDVIVCDLGLPDIDGYEIARRVRGDESLRDTRLVALSGYAQPEDRERAREAGFDVHLSKPAPLEQLAAIVEGRSAAAVR